MSVLSKRLVVLEETMKDLPYEMRRAMRSHLEGVIIHWEKKLLRVPEATS